MTKAIKPEKEKSKIKRGREIVKEAYQGAIGPG
jgi:hypothetical protein